MGYDVLFCNILTVNASNYPRVVNSVTNSPDTFNLFATLAPKIAVIPPFNPTTTAFVNAPVDIQNPTTNYWSLSVQRELGINYAQYLPWTRLPAVEFQSFEDHQTS